jgi:serine/threonine protein kinase
MLSLHGGAALHVLRGLALAHERGIIHRDIKPGNILVSDRNILKVTDFGLAYVAMSPTVTMEGMVLGTPAYMAPEQVRGDEIDARTDLFALGVTLVEVITGTRIFEGSTYSECMKKVLAFRSDDVKQFESHSTPEFTEFLMKLLHPKKDERFSSAREALHALGEKGSASFLRPASVPSPKKTDVHPGYRYRPWCRAGSPVEFFVDEYSGRDNKRGECCHRPFDRHGGTGLRRETNGE